MESILKNTRPTAKQMYLDPRTKIFLCLCVAFIMLAGDGNGFMRYVRPCLAAVPLVFIAILKKPLLVAYYAGFYLFMATVPQILMPHFPPVINFVLGGIVSVSIQALPSMSMLCFLILTTTVSEFVAAMDSLHIPKKITVPISVMFRFFPTIREEYGAIRDAMRLRNVGSWRNPMEMLEYRMVPLLTGLVSIGNDLSASALTRGLNAPIQRTNICPIGFHWQDAIAFAFCAIILIIFTLSAIFGW